MPRIEDLQLRITIKQRRLQKLKEQQDLYGHSTPPEILIEIEDTEAELARLEAELTQLEEPAAVARPEPAYSPSPQAGEPAAWNAGAVRELVAIALSDEELTALCFDHFQPVYNELGGGMSKSQKIQRLLDYCQRHEQIEHLLLLIKQRNPTQYRRFEPQLKQ